MYGMLSNEKNRHVECERYLINCRSIESESFKRVLFHVHKAGGVLFGNERKFRKNDGK